MADVRADDAGDAHGPDERGRFGPYGGRYIPEALFAALGPLSSALHQLGPDELKHGLFRAIAFAESQPHHAGVAAAALSETSSEFVDYDGLSANGSEKLTEILQVREVCLSVASM